MTTIITIDGPAASGKSSVSRMLAKKLGWRWVSTGAFYRGLAFVALQKQMDLNTPEALAELVLDPCWSVHLGAEKTHVFYEGQDVTEAISQEDVGSLASRISQYPPVRTALLQAQRSCADGAAGLIAEGRDCGTVVFPTAQIKIFLTAHSELRAARRAAEQGLNTEATQEAQKTRDQQDTQRKTSPLQMSAEAIVLDSSSMTLFEVVDRIVQLVSDYKDQDKR